VAFRVPERPVSNQPNVTGDVQINAFDHVATIVNIPPGSFPLIGPDTFLGNIAGSSAPPVQQLLTTLAGSFLTYIPGTGVIDWDGVAVQKAGAPAGTQRTLNIIEGANITATVVNNTVTGAVDITLASTGGSGSAQSWAGTLEVSKFSGPWNPHIDAPQYISFGVEDAIPGVGHLRFSQDCHIEANFDGYFHVLGSLFLGGHASPNDATTIASDTITFDATDSLIGLSGDIMSLVSTNSAVVQSTASTLSLSGQTGATLTAQTGNAGISATTGLAAVTGSTQVQIVSAADVVCASLDDFRVMTGSPFTQRFQIDEFGAIGLGAAVVIGPAGQVITSQGPGAPPVWAAVDLSSVTYTAGDGINLSGNVFSVDATDIVDGVSIVEVATNNIQRAALTGFITASQGQNTTTSAEPLVTFGSSSNMTNERVLTAGANVSISTAVAGLIVVSATNTDTTYTAGDGIDLASNVFSVDVSDFAGTGLEDDGSNNLRIAAAAAGNGLTGGAGSALAVGGSTSIIVGADDVQRAALTGEVTAAQNSNSTSITRSTNFAWTGAHSWNYTGSFDVLVTSDVNINGVGGAVFGSSASAIGDATVGSVHMVADGLFRIFTAGTERLEIEPDGAWQVSGSTGSSGNALVSQGASASPEWARPFGALIQRTVYLSGSGTHTYNSATRMARVRMKGGGGAGGGFISSGVAAGCASGGGGGAGADLELWITSVPISSAYAVGAGGTGVTSAGGNNGGNTTFHDGVAVRTATGGFGGPPRAASTTSGTTQGGAGGTQPSAVGAFWRAQGHHGHPGYTFSLDGANFGNGGHGGCGFEGGTGGYGRASAEGDGNGGAGSAPGSGGGGAYADNSTTGRAGGAGIAGIIIVEEFA